jgi:hypothetical protein
VIIFGSNHGDYEGVLDLFLTESQKIL